MLALARAGATDEAAQRFERHGLAASREEDVAALEARIAKDVALAGSGAERRREAGRARDLYEAIFERTGGYYPAINAATLSLVAGEPERARELARTVLRLLEQIDERSYYAAATEGEAHLLLRDEAAAREALERAAAMHEGDHGALADDAPSAAPRLRPRGNRTAGCRHPRRTGSGAFLWTSDRGGRDAGRFPAEAERRVAAQIEAEVK